MSAYGRNRELAPEVTKLLVRVFASVRLNIEPMESMAKPEDPGCSVRALRECNWALNN